MLCYLIFMFELVVFVYVNEIKYGKVFYCFFGYGII